MATAESSFVRVFETVAKAVLGEKAIVERGANLFYELYLNRQLQLMVNNTAEPKRGTSAFQTDICVFENVAGQSKLPRVVIEFKERLSTHDVITYSAKAGQHKRVYPWLRYGLLASEVASIPGRFFTHNEHLDFFIAAKNYQDETTLRSVALSLIESEIAISKKLEEINFDDRRFDFYRREIVFSNFGRDTQGRSTGVGMVVSDKDVPAVGI